MVWQAFKQSLFQLQGHMEKELAEAKKDVEQLTSDLREKQLTIMKLHQVRL